MQAVLILGGDAMGHPMLGRQSVQSCPTWDERGQHRRQKHHERRRATPVESFRLF